MLKKLLVSLISLFTFLTVQAQDLSYAKPQASAPYRVAVGLRYSASGPGHTDLGITAKYFIGEQSALEAYANLPPAL
jgi:hypothetical protein